MNEEKKKQLVPGYLETITLTVTIVIGVLFFYDQYFVQKIYVADLKSYLISQRNLLASGQLTEAELKAGLDKIEGTLDAQAKNPRNIILLKGGVLRNGKNLKLENK